MTKYRFIVYTHPLITQDACKNTHSCQYNGMRESKATPNSYKIQKARMNCNLYIIIFIKKRGQAGRRALPNLKPYRIGGHPAPAGRALPNLINAVKMLKSTSTQNRPRQSVGAENFQPLQHHNALFCGFDFKHSDRIYKVG
jgi:hypothetical protein